MAALMIAGVDPSLGAAAVVSGLHDAPATTLMRRVFRAGNPADMLLPRMQRWRAHARQIQEHLDEQRVDMVVLEGYSFGSKGRATVSLGEFGGVLRMALLSLRVPVYEVPPTSLKKFVTGRGNADKTEVIATLARQHDITFQTNDEYDAFGLWLIGRCLHNATAARNKTQADIAIAIQNGTAKDK